MTRTRRLLLGVLVATGMTVALGVAVLSSDWAARRTQRELVRILEARFDARASIEEVTMAIFPRLSIDGRGFALTRTGDERLPFIRVDRFHASGSLMDVLKRTIGRVEIEGFQIDIARGPKPKGTGMSSGARDLRIDEIKATHGLLRDTYQTIRRSFHSTSISRPSRSTASASSMRDGTGGTDQPQAEGPHSKLRIVRPVEYLRTPLITVVGRLSVHRRAAGHHQGHRRHPEFDRVVRRVCSSTSG